MSLSKQIEDLIKQQIEVGIVDDCFSNEKKSEVYYVKIGNDEKFLCQVNPKRAPETRAVLKTGKKGCFLCEENMPEEERGIDISPDWKIYPNPRPYEKNHVVMVLKATEGDHPFQIIDRKTTIRKALETIHQIGCVEGRKEFNLTFNPVGAAASSRHFHYQIFECHLPVLDFPINFTREEKGLRIGLLEGYPAEAIIIEGDDLDEISSKVWIVIDKLNTCSNRYIPYTTLFKAVDDKKTRIYIFPRAAENPSETDPNLIGIKFGICEMCGMTIVYNEKMTNDIDLEIFKNSLSATSDKEILKEIVPLL